MRYFMTEVRVVDWGRSVAWYRDALGLRVALEDGPNGFALLEGDEGGARVALKRAEGAANPARGAVRLVFEVPDLDAMVAHLAAAGIGSDGPRSSPEGYREVRLVDPDGTPIALFSWTRLDSDGIR